MKEMWFRKYRPRNLEEYIFTDEKQKQLINSFISTKSIPNLLLYGHRGTGKTSLAYLLKDKLGIEDMDFLEINASQDNSINTIRTKVSSFVSTMASGDFKILFLDECDRISPEGMDALKKPTEDFTENVRVIFSTNKPNKLIPELRSRCQEIVFKTLDKDDMLEKIVIILKKEKVKTPSLECLDSYINITYPDFRKLINLIQQNVVDGVLNENINVQDNLFEVKGECLLYLEQGDWNKARKLLCENINEDDYEDMFRFFYKNLDNLDKFKDQNKLKRGLVLIAEYLYRNSTIIDKEINFCALMIKLSEV